MSDLQNIKNRFGIIGNYPVLNRALEKAIQVAPTDISVLVIGESGTAPALHRGKLRCYPRGNDRFGAFRA